MPPMEANDLLGTAEVAGLLGKSRSTITRWVHADKLKPAFALPGYRGDFLFDPASVEALREGKAA